MAPEGLVLLPPLRFCWQTFKTGLSCHAPFQVRWNFEGIKQVGINMCAIAPQANYWSLYMLMNLQVLLCSGFADPAGIRLHGCGVFGQRLDKNHQRGRQWSTAHSAQPLDLRLRTADWASSEAWDGGSDACGNHRRCSVPVGIRASPSSCCLAR